MMHPTQATHLLAQIQSDGTQLAGRGEEIEQLGKIPQDILEWIYDLKLFKLVLPAELGGQPTPLPELLRIFDELSAIDGSLGWLVHIGAAGGFFAPSFTKETAYELFSPREAVIAGSGFPAGRAQRVDGGYKVSGRWMYASGAQYATLFTASAVCTEGKGVGEECVRAFAFFPSDVHVIDDWNAFGLRGTASNTFVVEDVFVPDTRVFNVGETLWPVADPLFRVPFDILAATTIASVSIGLTRRFFELAQSMPQWDRLGERQRLAVQAQDNRRLFYMIADDAWSRIAAGEQFDTSELRRVVRMIQRLVDDSVIAVQSVFSYLGMRALWHSEPINRVYRDVQTASQHAYLRNPRLAEPNEPTPENEQPTS